MSKKHRRNKSPQLTPGSRQIPLNPNAGAMNNGPGFMNQSGTSSTGANYRLPGNVADRNPVQTQGGVGSKYSPDNSSDGQLSVADYIRDVDLGTNWFSPFQPVTPFGPPYVNYAREWDYPVGVNLNYIPARIQLYAQLRAMAETWGVLRAIIETRKDQLLALPHEFQVRGKPRAKSKALDDVIERFRKPDGKKRYGPWARMLLEDLFVIDAPTIYVGERNRGGQPMYFEVIDGATIKVLVDDAGRLPDYPQPAYQQIIKGLPMNNFTERDFIYSPMRPRPQSPIHGYSPVEQIQVELTEAIKKTFYQLGFWTEGNLPDMIMSVPEQWTPKQIASFQAFFDANLSGNLREKSKVRFVPHGMQPYDIKNAQGQEIQSKRDEMLIRLACYAFSVNPTPFIQATNRATAQTSQEEAMQEGLHPLMTWWKEDIMDPLVQEQLGYDEIEWVWLPVQEIDQLKRAQVDQIRVRTGMRTLNEMRDQQGDTPYTSPAANEPLVFTNNGVMTLDDALLAGRTAAMLPPGGAGGSGKPMDGSSQSKQNDKHDPGTGSVTQKPSPKEPPVDQSGDNASTKYLEVV